jgi:hypothetical protein
MRTSSMIRGLAVLTIAGSSPALGQGAQPSPLGNLHAVGAPANPKVPVAWDRYYDHAAVGEIGRRLQAAHPDRCRLSSIGKSTQDRELWMITVSNFQEGDADRKPAMYIDGNIHSNEIQGTETALYTAWYLCEMAGQVAWIDTLLAERTFYIVPTINPDARENFLKQPNTGSSPRSGMAPRDNDGDGVVDEDSFDDLNGDGHVTMMRRRSRLGRFVSSPEDPRLMIQALPGQPGEWELLGQEGFDNDGDGRVNEDGVAGSYDPNRNWPWRWMPSYVQGGSDMYPTSLAETQAVINFVLGRPNIAGAQSYHNSGGMLLRGPGMQQDEYRPQDVQVFDQIGRVGERILPGYRYMVVWRDLYTVWGGELDWFYGARGILTFSNELWTPFKYFEQAPERGNRYDQLEYEFDRLLLFGEAFVPWTKVQHPQFGEVEVGGMKKQYGRAVPGFLLPGENHRNMAFTLFQASQMPLVQVDSIAVRSLGGGLSEVTAIIGNPKLAPTHTQQDVENRISRPNWISLEGGEVVAGFTVGGAGGGFGGGGGFFGGGGQPQIATEQRVNPTRINVANIPGQGSVTVRWVVRGAGPFTVVADSPKGGVARRTSGR